MRHLSAPLFLHGKRACRARDDDSMHKLIYRSFTVPYKLAAGANRCWIVTISRRNRSPYTTVRDMTGITMDDDDDDMAHNSTHITAKWSLKFMSEIRGDDMTSSLCDLRYLPYTANFDLRYAAITRKSAQSTNPRYAGEIELLYYMTGVPNRIEMEQ